MYSKKEVEEETLKYFKGDDLATQVWIKKYCLKDEQGNLLEKSPDDMHRRMAKEFARIEATYPNSLNEEEIYQLFKDFKYVVPGGSQAAGIGNNLIKTSLSNCFVIDSAVDSYGGIFQADQEQVQIMKRRGGVGHDISNIRPSGMLANNSLLLGSAGQTLYMERFSNSTREVAQDNRRGALMLSTHVNHPDCDKFIDMKMESGKVTGANVSVKISDEFMDCLDHDLRFLQRFPINSIVGDMFPTVPVNILALSDECKLYPEVNMARAIKAVNPKSLWDKIIHNAWKSAEPGVLFWDTILRESPAGCYGEEWKETSTNPCGEVPLCPYDSCRLTAINLYSYVIEPFTLRARFDFPLFRKHTNQAQRIMDDLIDLEVEKIDIILHKIADDPEDWRIKEVEYKLWQKIREKAVQGRRTGLGITAEGDMLAALGLRYGTKEATEFAVEVHRVLAIESYKASIEMAEERGAFPIWDYNKEKNNPFIERLIEEENFEIFLVSKYSKYGRRNIANLTIAPVGTGSLMTQSTSGIEPLFQPFYKRRTKTDDKSKAVFIDEMGDGWLEFWVLHPKFKEWYEIAWRNKVSGDYNIEDYNESELQELFKYSPYYKATANDINWEESVRMQGAVQKWIDHSISKTVNLPADATIETVDKVYRAAYHSGCKGVTIYRDGCRQGVLLTGKEEKKETFKYKSSFKRPQTLECDIYHKVALKQDYMIIVGKVNGNPYEIFALRDVENHVFPTKIEKGHLTKVKSRTYELTSEYHEKTFKIANIVTLMTADQSTDTRKYSSMLRHGMHPQHVVDQIDEYASIVSFDKVVQRVLKNYIKEEQKKEKCPDCGSKNYHTDSGCWSCPDCGYAKCG